MALRTSSPKINASILLVDDNSQGLAARKAVLQELGHEVTTASRGAEAIEKFLSQEFQMVVTDYKMPRMDGIELIGHLRDHRPGISVILVSGFVEALGLTEESTGADAVIQKNAHEVGNLTRAVNRLLRKKPAGRQDGHRRAQRKSI